MKKVKKYILWQAATFIAACAIVLWLMPRDYSAKFHYEENRPWRYGTVYYTHIRAPPTRHDIV